jgi:hypothetical protein
MVRQMLESNLFEYMGGGWTQIQAVQRMKDYELLLTGVSKTRMETR